MSRLEARLTRELGEIADRATMSLPAIEMLKERAAEVGTNDAEVVFDLSPTHTGSWRRPTVVRGVLAVAASVLVVVVVLVGLLTLRSDDPADQLPADLPPSTTTAAPAVALPSDLVVPEPVGSLLDDWYDANERADGSVIELYLPGAHHLLGSDRYEYDEIAEHLSAGSWKHEWTSPPILIDGTDDGRYVVVRGMRNVHPTLGSFESSLTFEITTTDDGSLRISQSSWFNRD